MTRFITIGALACFIFGSMVDMTKAEEPSGSREFGLWLRGVVSAAGTSVKDTSKGLFVGEDADEDCLDSPVEDMTDDCLDEWAGLLNEALTEVKIERAGRNTP